ncbi:hypothetical protein PR048_011692 [Dryococelus australis]|uniref:Uncharacterized protein n=1 Tax=Dryococelus australis TaxID=614101 RepID=A0ABQ9HM88_9NEOP|nr:hypothetical protein PR048_011692 [Dryococelus australis]
MKGQGEARDPRGNPLTSGICQPKREGRCGAPSQNHDSILSPPRDAYLTQECEDGREEPTQIFQTILELDGASPMWLFPTPAREDYKLGTYIEDPELQKSHNHSPAIQIPRHSKETEADEHDINLVYGATWRSAVYMSVRVEDLLCYGPQASVFAHSFESFPPPLLLKTAVGCAADCAVIDKGIATGCAERCRGTFMVEVSSPMPISKFCVGIIDRTNVFKKGKTNMVQEESVKTKEKESRAEDSDINDVDSKSSASYGVNRERVLEDAERNAWPQRGDGCYSGALYQVIKQEAVLECKGEGNGRPRENPPISRIICMFSTSDNTGESTGN